MKKQLLSLLLGLSLSQQALACGGSDPDDIYFNLFAQDIITDKAFTPFLYEPSPSFYSNNNITIPDENIADWQAYFDNKLTYEQTKNIVYKATIDDLKNWLHTGKLENLGIKEIDRDFLYQHYTGITYLIEAKYLQPYMHIISKDDWREAKTVENLNSKKTIADLLKWYKQADDKRIKLRYGYQLVRFYHYNLKFEEAVQAFEEYVEPLNIKTAPYYMALDQYAGALNGLGQKDKANYLFFQVFLHTKRHKDSAFSSMKFSTDNDFNQLLAKAKNSQEKEMAYFLLAYQSFNNQLPMMEKIYELNPNSEVLKVLQARTINQLEWHFLSKYPDEASKQKNNRLPLKNNNHNLQFIKQLEKDRAISEKLYQTANDKAFWGISLAYLDFLQQKYGASIQRLNEISTDNPAYQKQISTLKMLNDIITQSVIDETFEKHLMKEYADVFDWNTNEEGYEEISSTTEFVIDILANRYFIQGDLGKSFLMQNKLSDLLSVRDNTLTKSVDQFYQKTDKNPFEKKVLMRQMNVTSPDSLFNLLYGDNAMHNGDFSKALTYYRLINNTDGIVPTTYEYYDKGKEIKTTYAKLRKYDRFNHISNTVFGQNREEHFNASISHTMTLPIFIRNFDFIKDKPMMNKVELAEKLVKLQAIAKGDDEKAGQANQLIGNVIYNTSKLGYFRQLFIDNFSNGNDWRYGFYGKQQKPRYYYGSGWRRWEMMMNGEAFDKAIGYYKKALTLTKDREQKAIILFQLASAEQGKYYQWQGKQDKYDKDLFKRTKNDKFRTYFKVLKKDYADTYTVKQLESSCSYFKHFMNSDAN